MEQQTMNDHVHPIFADMLKTFAPIPVGKVAPAPTTAHTFANQAALTYRPNLRVLEEAADDMAEWAQGHAATFRPAKPADADDVFSEDDSYADSEDVRELLSHRPAPTPNGKWVGLATDACAALFEIVQSCRVPANYDVFSEVDVDRWTEILKRAGYRL